MAAIESGTNYSAALNMYWIDDRDARTFYDSLTRQPIYRITWRSIGDLSLYGYEVADTGDASVAGACHSSSPIGPVAMR